MARKSTPSEAPRREINHYQGQMGRIGTRRANHLTNVGLSALKYLILNVESDALQFETVKLLMSLPPVQERLRALNQPDPRNRPKPAEDETTTLLIQKLLSTLEETGSLPAEVLEIVRTSRQEAEQPAPKGKGPNGAITH